MSGSIVLLRPAEARDIAEITAIYRPEVLAGSATFELEPPDEAEMARRWGGILGNGFPYLVAELDGRVAGYAYANLYRTRPAYRFTVEDSIYVRADAQGRGIGRKLLEELIALCTAGGSRQMMGVIGDSINQKGSVRLHEALGFTIAGRLPSVGFKHGRWLDTLIMQRPLGPGDSAPPESDR